MKVRRQLFEKSRS